MNSSLLLLARGSLGNALLPLPVTQSIHQNNENLGEVIAIVDQQIETFVASKGFPENLHNAINYAVLGGGKRLRPALAWFSSLACAGTGADSICAGIAVELIHAFSLVHDDLPALDDDELRRGRPTLHIHANEPMAILAGDAMLSLAYEAVQGCADISIAQRLAAELAKGTRAMIIGQVYDTLGGLPADSSPEDQLKLIHRNKTGALLTASCRMGAICSHATDQQLDLITQYAQAIGLQFQVVDDLLDIDGCSVTVGKALGKDAAAGKLTYPGILGVEHSRQIVEELGQQASNALEELEGCSKGSISPLRALGEMLTSRRQ